MDMGLDSSQVQEAVTSDGNEERQQCTAIKAVRNVHLPLCFLVVLE